MTTEGTSGRDRRRHDGVLAVLDAERERVRLRLEHLRDDFAGVVVASRDSNADDEHDPEGATIAFERQQVAALVEQALARLDRLDRAVARAHDGRYGTCAACGRPVGVERLAARPEAERCVTCA